MDNLLAALLLGLVNTTVAATGTALSTSHHFTDWEWEMLTTPVGA
jgi:hypothetical protein